MAETYSSRTLRELVRIIASRFVGMALITVVMIAAVAAASFYAPRWYRSEVLLKAEPGRITNPLLKTPSSLRDQVTLFVSTQREIVMSDYVLASALMRLEYPTRANNGSKWNQVGKPFFSEAAVDEFISKASEQLRRFRKRVSVVTPGGADATFTQTFKIQVNWPEVRSRKAPVELDSLAEAPTNGDVDTGYLTLPPKERAAKECFLLAKWIVKAYMTRYSELATRESALAKTFIKDNALAEVKRQLDKAADEFASYSKKLGPDLTTVVSLIGDQGADTGIAGTLDKIDVRISTIDASLARFKTLQQAIAAELAKKDPAKIAVPDEVITTNSVITLLQAKITTLKMKLNKLTPEFTDKFKDVENLKKELKAGYGDLHGELVKQQERTKYTVELLESSRANLEAQKKSLQDRMARLGQASVEYDRLKKSVAAATENYDRENRQFLDSIRAENLARNPVLVSTFGDPGRPNPKDPRRPVVWLNLLLACIAGLVLSLVYAFLADHFDHTIKGIDDAERYLGTPVLGSVPKLGRKIIRT